MAVREVILAIDDDRAVDDLAQQQGRSAPAAVRDDQVGAQARPGAHRVVHRPALLELVSVRSAATGCHHSSDARPPGAPGAARASRASRRRGRTARKTLHQEAAPPAVAPGQLQAEPAELGGERVVDEKNVHDLSRWAATSAVNRSASRGRQTSWAYRSRTAPPRRPPRGGNGPGPRARPPPGAPGRRCRDRRPAGLFVP